MQTAKEISEKPRWAWKETGYVLARHRCLFPPARSARLVDRAVAVLWPWRLREYPGIERLRCWLLGVHAVETGDEYRDRLPMVRAKFVADRLRAKRDEISALIAELEAYAAAGGMRREPQKLTRKIVSPPVE